MVHTRRQITWFVEQMKCFSEDMGSRSSPQVQPPVEESPSLTQGVSFPAPGILSPARVVLFLALGVPCLTKSRQIGRRPLTPLLGRVTLLPPSVTTQSKTLLR